MSLACYYYGQKYYPIPYKTLKDCLYIIATCLIVYLVNKIQIDNQITATAFHIFVILIFAIGIFFIEKIKLSKKQI
jgi:hypothetical protein